MISRYNKHSLHVDDYAYSLQENMTNNGFKLTYQKSTGEAFLQVVKGSEVVLQKVISKEYVDSLSEWLSERVKE